MIPKSHYANIAVAINRVYSQSGADQETVRLVAESLADTLERNPSFDRDRFLLMALYNWSKKPKV